MSGWLDQLPHGPAFRFLTDVRTIDPGVSGTGVMAVTGEEPWFAAHFPGRPIVPFVLLIEALAQLAGLVAWSDRDDVASGALAQVDMRTTQPVSPPAQIDLHVDIERRMGALARCHACATIAGAEICTGHLVLTGAPGPA